MKNIKKMIAALLILVLALSLAACGGKEAAETPENEVQEAPEAAAVPAEEAPAEEAPAEEAPAEEAAEPENEYGKTTEDATGIVELETLKTGFKWLYEGTHDGARPTYEEIREKLGGVDGKKDHEDSWKEGYHVYTWRSDEENQFLVLSFNVNEDGSETWNSSSWSSKLKDW